MSFSFKTSCPDTKSDNNRESKLYQEFLKMKSMNTCLSVYKPAVLSKSSNDWFVYYYYFDPQSSKYKRFKVRFDINRIKNIQDKIIYGKQLTDFINDKLSKGFNPLVVASKTNDSDFRITTQLIKVINALSANASKISQESYRDVYNRYMRFIKAKKYEHLFINSITLDHCKSFKRWMLYEEDLSVKTANNTLSHLSMFWDAAIENNYTLSNPFKVLPKAKKRDKDETGKDVRFEPFTNEEMQLLFPWLRQKEMHAFINFLCFIYYAWARPIEILRLKVEDIEKTRQLIAFKANNTKNTNAAYVQIVPPLMALIDAMKLEQYPPDYYLFSDNYLPGKRMLNKSNPSKTWRNNVKKNLKLQKDMYALKHTGNIEYLLNNKGKTDLKWQQMQNRHSSSVMTDRYNRKLGAYFIDVGEVNFRLIE